MEALELVEKVNHGWDCLPYAEGATNQKGGSGNTGASEVPLITDGRVIWNPTIQDSRCHYVFESPKGIPLLAIAMCIAQAFILPWDKLDMWKMTDC